MPLDSSTTGAWIDITRPIVDGMATWPGDPPVRIRRAARIEDGGGFQVSTLATSVHLGTHVDAPAHVLPGGAGVEHLSLDALIGPSVVTDVFADPHVDAPALRSTVEFGAQRVLLRTRNSAIHAGEEAASMDADPQPFRTDFAALTPQAARHLVERGVRLVGIDGPSIAPWDDLEPVHRILLSAGVIVLEGILLSHVLAGRYDLVCLPLQLNGCDGAPARALLRPR